MVENVVRIRPALTSLKSVQAITFPISLLKSFRTQASELGAIYNRQYKTQTNRENMTITVKRID